MSPQPSNNAPSEQATSPYMLHGSVAAQDVASTSGAAPQQVNSAVPPPVPVQNGAAQTSQSAGDTADNAANEELDREWVERAKKIVEQTKGDPFTQNNEISKLKAEYLRVRFNKDIKITEDNTQ